jgi:hypothetical protein
VSFGPAPVISTQSLVLQQCKTKPLKKRYKE